jgi:hypothetical protein
MNAQIWPICPADTLPDFPPLPNVAHKRARDGAVRMHAATAPPCPAPPRPQRFLAELDKTNG